MNICYYQAQDKAPVQTFVFSHFKGVYKVAGKNWLHFTTEGNRGATEIRLFFLIFFFWSKMASLTALMFLFQS